MYEGHIGVILVVSWKNVKPCAQVTPMPAAPHSLWSLTMLSVQA